MSRPSARRSGFTLVELMIVILVIGILATITFGLFKAANSGRNKSKSRGEIQAISMACQSYRRAYGDFPVCASGTDDRFRRDLLDQLIGRRVIRGNNGTLPTLVEHNDQTLPGGTGGRDDGSPSFKGRKQRSFLSLGDVTTNDDSSIGNSSDWNACREFVDAWGNPYDYRYRVLVSPARYQEWRSPNFLLVSCSANYNEATVLGEPPAADEYWQLTGANPMTRSGFVPATYFDESGSNGPYRADNIVNWSN